MILNGSGAEKREMSMKQFLVSHVQLSFVTLTYQNKKSEATSSLTIGKNNNQMTKFAFLMISLVSTMPNCRVSAAKMLSFFKNGHGGVTQLEL